MEGKGQQAEAATQRASLFTGWAKTHDAAGKGRACHGRTRVSSRVHLREVWECPSDFMTRRALVTFAMAASGADARLQEGLEHLLRGGRLGDRALCDSPYQLWHLFLGLFPNQLVLHEGRCYFYIFVSLHKSQFVPNIVSEHQWRSLSTALGLDLWLSPHFRWP